MSTTQVKAEDVLQTSGDEEAYVYDLEKHEALKHIILQFHEETGSLQKYAEKLAAKLRVPLEQQQNGGGEEYRLLWHKVKAYRDDYDRVKEMLKENVSEGIKSIYAMLSEIHIKCGAELEKLYQEYADTIRMMKVTMEKAHEDYMLLLQKSMVLGTKISLFNWWSYNCLAENTGVTSQLKNYDAENIIRVLCIERMAAFQMMRSKMVQQEDLLLMQKSMNLSWEPSVSMEGISDIILQLKNYAENVHKAEDHLLMDTSDFEVEDHCEVGRSEDEVEDDPTLDECDILEDDQESIPPLELCYYQKLAEQLPPLPRKLGLEAVASLLWDVEYFSSAVKNQEIERCDMLKHKCECLERELCLMTELMSKKNVCDSRQVDSLATIVSVVTDNYLEKLQTMSTKFGSVIEWMKSKNEFIQQENGRLGRLIADQKTKLCSIEKDVGMHMCGKMDLCIDFDERLNGETVKDWVYDSEPMCSGGTSSSSEIISPMLDNCTYQNLGVFTAPS